MKDDELAAKLGLLLGNSANEHDEEYDSFQIHHNSFFQKLISRPIIENDIRILPEDYLKILVFLDYFTQVIMGETGVLSNLEKISKISAKKTLELDAKAVVLETVLYSLEKNPLSDQTAQVFRHALKNATENADAVSNTNLYYEAIGFMAYDLISTDYKGFIENINGKNDYRAIVFTDCIAAYLNPKKVEDIKNMLSKGDYVGASVLAINSLNENNSLMQELSDHLTSLVG